MEPVVYTLCWEGPFSGEQRRRLLPLLPPARRERLPQGRPEGWDQPLAAYGLLALGLWEQFGRSRPPEMAATAAGKPWFPEEPAIHFSLSHTKGAVACGLWDRPIGVDVERRRSISPRLLEQLGAADEEAFLRLWVRREAAAKRLGLGSIAALRRPVEGEELCQVLSPGQGVLAAVAAEGGVGWQPLDRAAFWKRLEPLVGGGPEA